MAYMSESQFKQKIREGEALGVPRKVTYENLRQRGYHIEGDPAEKQYAAQRGVLEPVSLAADEGLGGFMKNVAKDTLNTFAAPILHPVETFKTVTAPFNLAAQTIVKDLGGGEEPTYQENIERTKGMVKTPVQIAESAGAPFRALAGGIERGINKATGIQMFSEQTHADPIGKALGLRGQMGTASATLPQEMAQMYERPVGTVMDMTMAASVGNKLLGAPPISRTIPSERQPIVDQAIDEGISKGLRPSVSGKDTLASRTRYTENSRHAVRAIVENKDKLRLTDEYGNAMPEGSLPQNLNQFAESVDQLKKATFDEYNGLQKQAGKAGIEVELDPLAQELFKLADDPTIQDLAPAVSDYARAKGNALARRAVYSTDEAQTAAATLNARLQAFHKNPNPNDISVSIVDAMIKNHLTEGVDNAVLKATESAEYMPLRRRYASLKAVEKDINNRAVVAARQSNKGFFDLSNVFSYGDVVKGVMTANAPQVAKGLFQRGISAYYKFRNDPNTILRDMFRKVDQAYKGVPQRSLMDSAVAPTQAAAAVSQIPDVQQ